jgi:hypothetical protein
MRFYCDCTGICVGHYLEKDFGPSRFIVFVDDQPTPLTEQIRALERIAPNVEARPFHQRLNRKRWERRR